jgi:cytochrome c-type biogenesis protein CcmH
MTGDARPERPRTAWGSAATLAVLLLATAVRAQSLDDRVYAVSRQLMCPVCAGQTVAESDAAVAREMRAIIRQKLLAGESQDQILWYFVAQFGDGVLAEPPRRGLSVVLYLGPLLALTLGLVIAAVFIRRWTRAPSMPVRP